jgi:hypothetical protein
MTKTEQKAFAQGWAAFFADQTAAECPHKYRQAGRAPVPTGAGRGLDACGVLGPRLRAVRGVPE